MCSDIGSEASYLVSKNRIKLVEEGSCVFSSKFILESGPDFVRRLLRSKENKEFWIRGLDKVRRRVLVPILKVGVIIGSIVFIVLFACFFSNNYIPAVK